MAELQSRTFFGTISRFLRHNLNLDDYRQFDTEGNSIVCTKRLYKLLKETWVPAETGVSRKELRAMLKATWNCLDYVDQMSKLHLASVPLLVLASKLLVGSLAIHIDDHLAGHNRIELFGSSSYFRGLSTIALRSHMVNFGACSAICCT